jgi:hypothetical protein
MAPDLNPFARSRRFAQPLAASALMIVLAACSQTATPPPPVAPATSSSFVTPAGFRLPEGSGCGADIARFQAIMDNDLSTGHVNRSVYERMTADMSPARAQCQAGNDGTARASLAAVKRRYGYPG